MKKLIIVTSALLLVIGIYLTQSTINSETPTASAKNKDYMSYSGTIYIAGMGGHFAAAEVEINPGDIMPIKLKELDKIDIGDKNTHPTHDPRIDVNDRTKLYWSTYKIDKEAKGRTVHVGVSDLKSGDVIKDQQVQLPERAKWTGALYCASGQTKDSFMPITMSNEAFLDVFDKQTLELKKRVYFDSLGYKDNYFFLHGINAPDMKTFALTINMTKPWVKPDSPAERLGKIDMILLDLPELEKGNLKVVAKNTITGSPNKTLSFRQSFTPDGKYLLQSAADRFYLLKGDDMSLVDEEMMTEGDNHDAISTPDGKYAVLTLRKMITSAKGESIKDGMLQLYDIQARKLVGKPVSTCYACHQDAEIEGNATLCGADANWNL